MSKILFGIFCILVAPLMVWASSPDDEVPAIQELRAVEVSFFGGITGFDRAGYKTLQSSIANLIVEGKIANYITTAIGKEGGSSFCVELINNPDFSISVITDVLDVIRPSAITIYKYELVKKCI